MDDICRLPYAYQLNQFPYVFTKEALAKLAHHTGQTTLVLGTEDFVGDPELAFQRAKEAGIDIIPVHGAGHLWSIEMPGRFVETNMQLLLKKKEG